MGGVIGGGGSSSKMPVVQADNPSKKAEKTATYDVGKDKQKKMAASLMTKYWDDPLLSDKDLLGM